jgi:DnaJ-class molecular chaperone
VKCRACAGSGKDERGDYPIRCRECMGTGDVPTEVELEQAGQATLFGGSEEVAHG